MSKFNIGDRVECIKAEFGIPEGTKGIIHDVDEKMIAVIPEGESGWHWFDNDNFKWSEKL